MRRDDDVERQGRGRRRDDGGMRDERRGTRDGKVEECESMSAIDGNEDEVMR